MNVAVVGKMVDVTGYGPKLESKTEQVQVVGMDADTAVLRFKSARDPSKTLDRRYRRSDGRAIGAQGDSGFELPAASLKLLWPESSATGNRAERRAAKQRAAGENGKQAPVVSDENAERADGKKRTDVVDTVGEERKSRKGESKERKTRAPRATGDPIVVPASDWHPERVRHQGAVPAPKANEVRLRVSSRGYFAMSRLDAFKHVSGETAEKAAFVDAWENRFDKRWLYLNMPKPQAQYLMEISPDVMTQLGPGHKRSLVTIQEDIHERFPEIAIPKAASKKVRTPPAPKAEVSKKGGEADTASTGKARTGLKIKRNQG